MDCNEFLDRYSEYHDDEATLPDRARFEAHLEGCATCRRYQQVVAGGVTLLRELPVPSFREDFRDRLQHRLYLTEYQERRAGLAGALNTPMALGLAAAALLAVAAAWGPMLTAVTPLPVANLPAITAAVPDAVRARAAANPGAGRAPAALVQPDYWVQSHTLLYEHSSVYHRNRQGGFLRTGIQ